MRWPVRAQHRRQQPNRPGRAVRQRAAWQLVLQPPDRLRDGRDAAVGVDAATRSRSRVAAGPVPRRQAVRTTRGASSMRPPSGWSRSGSETSATASTWGSTSRELGRRYPATVWTAARRRLAPAGGRRATSQGPACSPGHGRASRCTSSTVRRAASSSPASSCSFSWLLARATGSRLSRACQPRAASIRPRRAAAT